MECGKKTKDFEIDPTLGCYTYKGKVVLAAATTNLLKGGNYTKRDHIHYFTYPDEVKFTLDGKAYTGIIIDSCGASMKVKSGSYEILDMMFPTNKAAKESGVNQKVVEVKW